MADRIMYSEAKGYTVYENGIFTPNIGLSSTDKLVYLCLCKFADNSSREAFPGQKRIALECELSRKSVNVSIKNLQHKGFLTVQRRRTNKGAKTTNLYIVHLANKVVNSIAPTEPAHVTVGYNPCNPELHTHVTVGYINNTILQLPEEQQQDPELTPTPTAANTNENIVVVINASQEEDQTTTEPVTQQATATDAMPTVDPNEIAHAEVALLDAGVSAKTTAELLLNHPVEIITQAISYAATKKESVENPAGYIIDAIKGISSNEWTIPTATTKKTDTAKKSTEQYLQDLNAARAEAVAPTAGLFEQIKAACRGKKLEPQLE